MGKLIVFLLLSLTGQTWGQTTGAFEISKTSFKDLFNNYRFASPKIVPWAGSFFPYSEDGTAVKLNEDGDVIGRGGRSPLEAYSLLGGQGKEAEKWEKAAHSCGELSGELKQSCGAWWGHCNGWAAAAIKESEPRKEVRVAGKTLSVGEQKGILSELWLASYSLNAGLTDKSKKTGSWVHTHTRRSSSYDNFWDVTPKAFFYIFTNYVGALKSGVVIDRFTGDEVWNQPIVGYRLLPIRNEDISKVSENGRSYWSVKIRIKIYWANDSGISPGHVSKPFNIASTKDDEDVDYVSEDYEGRYLAFRLNFDSEVKVSDSGKKITAAGKMVGEGIWEHQENSRDYSVDELNMTHPDFIWVPTNPYQDNSGYGNPYLDAAIVEKIGQRSDDIRPSPQESSNVLQFIFAPRVFGGAPLGTADVKKQVAGVLRREGIRHAIYLSDIQISRNRVVLQVKFPVGPSVSDLEELFYVADMPAKIEQLEQ